MRAHYLQHVSFEGLGAIAPWLQEAGYAITATKFFESSVFPEPESVDLLIVMGGPMSANDEDVYPWLVAEKQFIRQAIDAGKAVVGICLGAQLIASAMGAAVYQNKDKEIGWYPIEGIASAQNATFSFPAPTSVFHWHGETFDLPSGATLLASSQGCVNQAFQLNSSVVGLQFHLETTPESAREIVANCAGELTRGKYIQTKEEILAATAERYGAINQLMTEILSFLLLNKA